MVFNYLDKGKLMVNSIYEMLHNKEHKMQDCTTQLLASLTMDLPNTHPEL